MADLRDVIEAFIAPSIEEQIAKQFYPYEVSWLQSYVAELGQASDRPEVQYRAYGVPGDAINAFTIPGGASYIYQGLLSRFNEPVICGVLGHEIAHEAERHVMDKTITAYGIQLLTDLVNQGRTRDLAELVLKVIWRGYERGNEFEADICSVHYNLKADLWPYGIKYFLEWLVSVEEAPTDALKELLGDLLATHPPAAERLEKVNAELARLGIEEKSYGWEKAKKILPYLLPLGIAGGIVAAIIYFARRK